MRRLALLVSFAALVACNEDPVFDFDEDATGIGDVGGGDGSSVDGGDGDTSTDADADADAGTDTDADDADGGADTGDATDAEACTPDEAGCLDETTAFLCSSDGATLTELPCVEGDICVAGACERLVCEPDAVRCDGDDVVTCNATGTARSRTICAETDACEASTFGCTCEEGACAELVCLPGTGRCVGQAAQACSADGLGYDEPVSCGDGTCRAGVCLAATCDPGTTECAGDVALICNDDGETRDEVDCAAAGLICVRDGDDAGCDLPICEPLSRVCADAGEALEICDGRGATLRTEPCPAESYCDAGRCEPWACDPASGPRCDGDDVVRCDARGTGLDVVETCGDGAICREGACIEQQCEPNARFCDGETRVRCDGEGFEVERVDCSAEDAFCDAGSCEPFVCDPADPPVCDGDDVVVCVDGGRAQEVARTCDEGCEDGSCNGSCGDGILDEGEDCDDGEDNGSGRCTLACQLDEEAACEDAPDLCAVVDPGEPPRTVTLTVPVTAETLDVGILMDTTGSMGEEIVALRDSFVGDIVPALREEWPGLGVGVARYDDYPCDGYGSVGDLPFELVQRVTTDVDDVNDAIEALRAAGGNDSPESLFEALYQLGSGRGRVEPDCADIPSFSSAASPARPGVSDGSEGGLGFRDGARRVGVVITDQASHEKGRSGYPYGATRAEAIDALRASGVRVIGVASAATPEPELVGLAQDSGAVVPACAWDGRRPAGCSDRQCCTGTNGAGVSAIDGQCPLVYRVDGDSGLGIDRSLADGLAAATQFTTFTATVRSATADDDASCLLSEVRAVRATNEDSSCLAAPTLTDVRAPGALDGFVGVRAGSTLEFELDLDAACLRASEVVREVDLELEVVTPDGYVLSRRALQVVVPARPGGGTCGNGIVEGEEACDDGNDIEDDGCSSRCEVAVCGDGVIQTSTAVTTVAAPRIDGRAVCDDGATCPLGSCTVRDNHLAPEHGICEALGYQRAVAATWGYGGSTRGPIAAGAWDCFEFGCSFAEPPARTCSEWEWLDEISCVQGREQCDDGPANALRADACRPDCTLPRCGDAIVDSGEACDDGLDNAELADRCRLDCTLPRCGDGVIDSDEECDDGNRTSGDGCNASCDLEFVDPVCVDVPLGSTLGLVWTGSTTGAGQTRSGSCGGSDADDVTHAWTAPATGTYRFSTAGSEFDTVLYVREWSTTGCTGAELACNDEASGASGTSEVEVALVAGQRVLVIVDGYSEFLGTGSSGPYELRITAL